MTSINFVLNGEPAGSDHYRLILPAKALKANGVDAEIVLGGQEVRDADTWVFSRPQDRNAVQVISELAEIRRVVVDMDDRFDCVRPGHAMYGPPAEAAHNFALWACKLAHRVTATTQAIADTYGGVVIPNYIPAWYLGVEGRHIAPTKVGWAGTIASHPNDLQVTNGQVARAAKESNARIAFIGDRNEQEAIAKALRCNPRSILSAGFHRFDAYPRAIAEFDVGIVPLESCSFNSAKSWLKLLEFSALGVPTVASPTEPNKLLGAGLLAKYPNDWYRLTKRLISDAGYRAEMAATGRETAAKHTIEKNVDRWADVL